MADYHINPPPPIEMEKSEIIQFVLELNQIHKQISEVNRSLPYGPGNIVIKNRLSVALESCQNLISKINTSYLL